ncbi:hypothetical protein BOX15_Mlig005011g1, partial [Macrostomum lignano]
EISGEQTERASHSRQNKTVRVAEMLFSKYFFCLNMHLLLLSRCASHQLDMLELDRYLSRKLEILTNFTHRQPTEISGSLRGGSARIVYFGNFNQEESSNFQSSLSLLALLPKYSRPGDVESVGFVDTSSPAGDRLRTRLGIGMLHSIVGWTKQQRAAFLGYRNVQLLLDFVDRLLLSEPLWLTGKKDKSKEAAVLLLPEGTDRLHPDLAAQLAEIAVEMPAYIGSGRRLATAYGTVPGSLVYRSPVTGSLAAARLRDHSNRSLHAVLRYLRSGQSVIPLSAGNLYLPASEAEHWNADKAGRAIHGKPLLILLADPESQAAASAALALMKRLVQQRKQRQHENPPWLAASLNPWRRLAGEPQIDWSGVLGGPELGRGPCFLMTINRRFGGSEPVGREDVFHLDEFRLDASVGGGSDGGHAAAMAGLQQWLRGRLEHFELSLRTEQGSKGPRAEDEL